MNSPLSHVINFSTLLHHVSIICILFIFGRIMELIIHIRRIVKHAIRYSPNIYKVKNVALKLMKLANDTFVYRLSAEAADHLMEKQMAAYSGLVDTAEEKEGNTTR